MPMTNQGSTPHDIGILKICIDDLVQGDFAGRIMSRYLPREAQFTGVSALLTKMEQMMDALGYPQKYCRERKFNQSVIKGGERSAQSEVVRQMAEDAFLAQAGRLGTFVVQVQFRQNATWQGRITWNEHGGTEQFDSTLELIRLMDDAARRIDGVPSRGMGW